MTIILIILLILLLGGGFTTGLYGGQGFNGPHSLIVLILVVALIVFLLRGGVGI